VERRHGGPVQYGALSGDADLQRHGGDVVGLQGPQAGIAKVYLDGAYQVDVDCYASTETVRAVLFTRSGLAAGPHTLAIEATGTRNTAATDAFIAVDAFDVQGVPGGRIQETGLPTTV